MKYRYATCLFLLAYISQTTLMNIVSVAGVTPNLLLCLVVIFSFMYDEKKYGIVLGVIFGLLYDIAFAQYVGIAALAFLIIAIAIMAVRIVMSKETVFSIVIIGSASTAVYTLIYWAIMALLGSNWSFMVMLSFLPVSVAYNTVVIVILYCLMIKRVTRHYEDRYYK